jgi:hypothetical protein
VDKKEIWPYHRQTGGQRRKMNATPEKFFVDGMSSNLQYFENQNFQIYSTYEECSKTDII